MSAYSVKSFNNNKLGTKDHIISYVVRPAIARVLGALMSNYMHPGESANIDILGFSIKNVKRSTLAGIGFGAGTILADLAHDQIFPHIFKNKKYQHLASLIASGGISLATVYAIHGLISAKAMAALPLMEMAPEAALIMLGTDWITDRVIVPSFS